MEAVAWDVARKLSQLGNEVHILTTACAKLAENHSVEDVSIMTLPVPSGVYSMAWWRQSRAAFHTHYAADTDVVLSVSVAGMSIVRSRHRAPKTRFAMQVHGTSWGEIKSKLSEGRLLPTLKVTRNLLSIITRDPVYRRFDTLIAIGPAVEAELKRAPVKWWVGKTPIVMIPNGIDEAVFYYDMDAAAKVRKALGISPEDRVVISACRLVAQKGGREALLGFAEAAKRRPDLKYIIIGDGPEEGALKSLSASLGIADKVVFAGRIERGQLYRYYSAGDVFLFTTLRQEGLALGPLEAAASGLHCILSEHIRLPDFTAQYVDPSNAASVAGGLDAALHVAETSCRARIPEGYGLEQSIKAYGGLFAKFDTSGL